MGAQPESVDAVVIGSGFGGAVAAHRLAEAGRSVIVLERGRPYPPGSFARTRSEVSANFWSPDDQLYGLFETWSFRGLEGIVSSGLGGGSLIDANVHVRKDPGWFVTDSPLPGGGYETWPVTRDDLEPHYDAVEQMILPRPYPRTDTPKTLAFEKAATAIGRPAVRPPLAISFGSGTEGPPTFEQVPQAPYGNIHGAPRLTCILCGECALGCNVGAKNTLDHTYLSAARHLGADIRTLHEVSGFRPAGDMWEVRFRVHDPQSGTAVDGVIRCRRLILAAGTFATTALLLANRASIPGLSAAVGTRFCGNGDVLGFLVNSARPIQGRGPVTTSTIRVGDVIDGDREADDGVEASVRGYYIADAGYPGLLDWLVELSQPRAVISRGARAAARVLRDRLGAGSRTNLTQKLAAALGGSSSPGNALALLGMGRDVPDGRMYLEDGRLQIDWTSITSIAYIDRVRSTMAQLADAMGADYVDNPLWRAKRLVTMHPLGGAPMGRSAYEGVVDEWGKVFGTEGLYVVDGSIMPGPVGPHPALTIAAMSDRAMRHAIDTEPRSRRKSAPPPPPRPRPRPKETPMPEHEAIRPGVTSVSFTEQMKGFVKLDAADPRAAYEDARLQDEKFMFELTVTAPDIDAFVADPTHEATAAGYVDADVLGGRTTVDRGWVHLFTGTGDESHDRRMLYRLWLTPASGAPFTMVGVKEVHDDPGFDTWEDTTTLFVQLLEGHISPGDAVVESGHLPDDDPRVRGAGVLRILPLDLAEQLTTFRTEGSDGAAALARFGSLFFGQVWGTYAGMAKPKESP